MEKYKLKLRKMKQEKVTRLANVLNEQGNPITISYDDYEWHEKKRIGHHIPKTAKNFDMLALLARTVPLDAESRPDSAVRIEVVVEATEDDPADSSIPEDAGMTFQYVYAVF